MHNNEIVARPYAKALFEYAMEKSETALWLDMLATLVNVTSEKDFKQALAEPQLPQTALVDILLKVIKATIPQGFANFLNVLANAHRLAFLPAIYKFYKEYYESAERIVDVYVDTACPLSKEFEEKLSELLAIKFNARIIMHVQVDKKLLAGAVIRVGDWVLDGSARGRLLRLANHLTVKEVL